MTAYGEVAVKAARSRDKADPVAAWDAAAAAAEAFPTSESLRRKSCPRSAFLGLCGEGLVVGIQKGDYTRSKLNRDHAIHAVAILRENPALAEEPTALWFRVIRGQEKAPNQQMAVVTALWKVGLIAEVKR